MKDHTVQFYQALLTEEWEVDSRAHDAAVQQLLCYILNLISTEDNTSLLRSVELSEVRAAVWRIDPDSALGVDEFLGRFYKSCWEAISTVLLHAVQESFLAVPVPRSVRSTLMILLPKKPSPPHLVTTDQSAYVIS